MQEALTSDEAEVLIRRLVGALPSSSVSCLLPLETQVRRNNRVLVSVPALHFKSGVDLERKDAVVGQLRALFEDGSFDRGSRKPWPQLQQRPEQRALGKRIAQGWRLLEKPQANHSEMTKVRSEAQGRNVVLWWLPSAGRPVVVGRVDQEGALKSDPAFFVDDARLQVLWSAIVAE